MSTSKSTEMDTEIQDVPQNLTPDEMYKGLDGDDTEVLDNNTKSLLMSMMGELKIGMDLTKVPIPCDFLEPRSLLEKLTDFLSHCQILCSAPDFDDPVARMVEVVRMYLSGWHVKPRGVKKPYNPILVCFYICTIVQLSKPTNVPYIDHHIYIDNNNNREKCLDVTMSCLMVVF
jgi:hypothetical protein